jgi:hypothetical protein
MRMGTVACAIAAALASGCSWMMVKPPDAGAIGPRAVCTETTFYQHLDEIYGALFAVVAVVGVPSFFDADRPGHDLAEFDVPSSAIIAGALLWAASYGADGTARCRAVHAQRAVAP